MHAVQFHKVRDGAGGGRGALLSGFFGLEKGQGALAVRIYKETGHFPRSETYGLTSQIRRAAVSIASNIAEGQGRLPLGEFQQFLGHARGSPLELDTQLAIACDLNYITTETLELVRMSTRSSGS